MRSGKGVLDEGFKQILRDNAGALSGGRGMLMSASANRNARTILVTSCHPGEGKTVTAVALAQSLSTQAEAQVLLLEGNVANPQVHRHFGIAQQPGLGEYLASEASLDEVICLTEEPRLMLLTLGNCDPSKEDPLRASEIARPLASLRDKFDYVICDGRPVFGNTDALAGVGGFDGIVLVVECERTRWEVVQDAKDRLEKAGGQILGVVLNKRRYYIPQALYRGG